MLIFVRVCGVAGDVAAGRVLWLRAQAVLVQRGHDLRCGHDLFVSQCVTHPYQRHAPLWGVFLHRLSMKPFGGHKGVLLLFEGAVLGI